VARKTAATPPINMVAVPSKYHKKSDSLMISANPLVGGSVFPALRPMAEKASVAPVSARLMPVWQRDARVIGCTVRDYYFGWKSFHQ